MPDLEAFEAEVKNKIRQLSSKDAKARRKAAAWLGEAGDPTAITALVQAYKNDRDPRVRDAARYSLGMFRALEIAWGEDQETVGQLLEDVALNGKIGGRVPIATRSIVKLELGLLLSAALVAALAFLLPMFLSDGTNRESPIPTSEGVAAMPNRDRATLLVGLRGQWQQITTNTELLRQEYQKALTNQALDCNPSFSTITDYTLSPDERRDFSDLTDIAAKLNAAGQQFTGAKAAYDRACQQGQPLDAGTVGPLLADLGAVSASLAEADGQLTEAQGAAIPATAAPIQAPTDAVPTPVPVNLREHLVALQQIVDDMTGLRGANTLLVQYWTEAKNVGATQGCRETVPTIPADYALPSDVAQVSPSLKLAVDLINQGLLGTRNGWQAFSAACATGAPGTSADNWLLIASAANTAFTTAATQLASLQ